MKIGLSIILLLIVSVSYPQIKNIYSISIDDINGRRIPLEDFKGKKILFIILPIGNQDASITSQLAVLQKKYQQSLVIVGVPAEEAGFKKHEEKKWRELYGNQRENFILSGSMKVKKAAKEKQSPIFQWLTAKGKNRHFDQDVKDAGHKYFIDEKGELYAVIGPEIPLSNPIIDKILSKVSNVNGY